MAAVQETVVHVLAKYEGHQFGAKATEIEINGLASSCGFVFRPGFPGAGARCDEWPNQNIGWTPAPNVFHDLRVTLRSNDIHTFEIVDGTDPSKTWCKDLAKRGLFCSEGVRVCGKPHIPDGLQRKYMATEGEEIVIENCGKHTFKLVAGGNPVATASTAMHGGVDADAVVHVQARYDGTQYGAKNTEIEVVNSATGVSQGFVFHPGYTGAGARCDGVFNNQNIGWTPSPSVYHELKVTVRSSCVHTFEITDGQDPSKTWRKDLLKPCLWGTDLKVNAKPHIPDGLERKDIDTVGEEVSLENCGMHTFKLVELRLPPRALVTVNAKASNSPAIMEISCTGMSGNLLATISAEGTNDVAWLRKAVSNETGIQEGLITMLTSDSRILADSEVLHSLLCTE